MGEGPCRWEPHTPRAVEAVSGNSSWERAGTQGGRKVCEEARWARQQKHLPLACFSTNKSVLLVSGERSRSCPLWCARLTQ